MKEIAVAAVDLECVQAEPCRATRSGGEGITHTMQAVAIQRHRRDLVISLGHGRGRAGDPASVAFMQLGAPLPGYVARGLAPRMCELQRNRHRRHLAYRGEYGAQRRFRRVVPQAEIAGRDPADRFHRGAFDDQKACTRLGEAAEMNQVPGMREAVAGDVLAHGRDDDAIGQGQATQRQRSEKRAHRDSLDYPVPAPSCHGTADAHLSLFARLAEKRGQGAMMPRRTAIVTAWVRSCAFSFASTLLMCALTVSSVTPSSIATARLELPPATQASTAVSRSVRVSSPRWAAMSAATSGRMYVWPRRTLRMVSTSCVRTALLSR